MEVMQRLGQELSEEIERQRSLLAERTHQMERTEAALAGLAGSLEALQAGEGEGSREKLLELKAQLARLRSVCLAGESDRMKVLAERAGKIGDDLGRTASLAALGELSTSVAHEIRNPLCGMLLSLEVLKTKMDADDSRMRLLDNVHREAEKMEKIVQNLLHFARKYRPRAVRTELEEAVRKSLESVRLHLEKSETSVRIRRLCDHCEAEVDPDLVQQVFRNVLLNSIDACPKGSSIDICLLAPAGENAVAVAFRDEGEGIKSELQQQIFEPFFTSRHKGVGLGLAVSKKIVEAHEGRIDVQSEPGKGATFTVTFPREAQRVAA